MNTNFHEEFKSQFPLSIGPVINGSVIQTDIKKQLYSPWDSSHFAQLSLASEQNMEEAIVCAEAGFERIKELSAYQRSDILNRLARLIERDKEWLAASITAESGKPISAARGEVERAIFTFTVAAEEAKRISGEIISLDWLPGNENRHGHVIRVARGPIAGISPFNFPINLVAHKVAPALAAGNPVIIRPATQTACTAIKLGQLVVEAGWPADAIAVVPSTTDVAKPLIEDDRIKLLTFTGSPAVGWSLKGKAGRKPVTLELGGNAGNIINDDANIDYALERVVWGGFVNAGQACISVQRVYIHQSIYDKCKSSLIKMVNDLPAGDPWQENTVVGPVIDLQSAKRIASSIQQAKTSGAKLLAGGGVDGTMVQPTLIENDDESLEVSQSEIFGPVIVITPFSDFKDAVQRVTTSDFGLQAGVFTRDLGLIQYAIEHIDVGGININDVSTFRIDHMPYGGVKDSGYGREGLKYAIEEMTEMKLVTYNMAVL